MLEQKYADKEKGRIPLPKNTQQLWSHHKYSVLALDPNLYKEIGAIVSRNGISFCDLSLILTESLRQHQAEGGIRNAEHLVMLLLPLPGLREPLTKHALGIIGSVLILLTHVYPFRKRILGKKGRENPITTHIIFGLLGPILVVAHSGGVFTSLIVNLVFLVMIGVVLSGITGRYLYTRIRRTLREYKQESSYLKQLFRKRIKDLSASDVRSCFSLDLALGGFDEEALAQEGVNAPTVRQCRELEQLVESVVEVEDYIQVYDASQRLFGKWLLFHYHLVFFPFVLMGSHIATVVYYGLPWFS